MKKLQTIAVLMVAASVIILLSFWTNNLNEKSKKELDKKITILAEEAYFDGQRDAIMGHVVIKYDSTKELYIWTDSPWDSRKPAQFVPTKKDNQVSTYKNK
jgi:hypothetical protein